MLTTVAAPVSSSAYARGMSTPTEGLTLGGVSAIVEKKILTSRIRIERKGEPSSTQTPVNMNQDLR